MVCIGWENYFRLLLNYLGRPCLAVAVAEIHNVPLVKSCLAHFQAVRFIYLGLLPAARGPSSDGEGGLEEGLKLR